MVIYIPTIQYKYIVITKYDTILQEYYITERHKSMMYEKQLEDTHELQNGISWGG